MKKFNCDHCAFCTDYKQNLLRHTEVKHPVQHVLGRKKPVTRHIGYVLGKEKKTIKCLCLPMFYTVQIWENLPKKKIQNKELICKHEDKQQGKGRKS